MPAVANIEAIDIRATGAGTAIAAIARAAQATGERFDFLLAQARLESGLNPVARARTSSATGLFQFIERTWLATIKRHGARHGLGWAADAIGWAGGAPAVASAAARAAILRLREDPAVAATMAAEHAADNRAYLEARLGRTVSNADLYLAHFLGPAGAARFLSAMTARPDAPAAGIAPGAAHANRAVFFTRDGQPRTLAEVFDRFAHRLARAGSDPAMNATPTPAPPAAPPGAPLPPMLPAALGLLALRAGERLAAAPAPATAAPVATAATPAIDPTRAAQAAYLLLARLG